MASRVTEASTSRTHTDRFSSDSTISKTDSKSKAILKKTPQFSSPPSNIHRSISQIDSNNPKALEAFLEARLGEILDHVQKNHPSLAHFRKQLARLSQSISASISGFKLSPYTYYKHLLEFTRKLKSDYQQKAKDYLVEFFKELRTQPELIKQWFFREDIGDRSCKNWYELILSTEVVENLSKDIETNEIFVQAQATRIKEYSLVRKALHSINWQKVLTVALVVVVVCGVVFVVANYGSSSPVRRDNTAPQNVAHQSVRRNLALQSPEFRIDINGTTPQNNAVAANGQGTGSVVWAGILSGDSKLTVQARTIAKDGPQGSQRTFRANDAYDFAPDSIQCKGNVCAFAGTQYTIYSPYTTYVMGRKFEFNTTQVTDLSLTGLWVGPTRNARVAITILNGDSAAVAYSAQTLPTYSIIQLQATSPYPSTTFNINDPPAIREKSSITDLTNSPNLIVGFETNEGGNWDCKFQRLNLTNPEGFTFVGEKYSATGGVTAGDQRNLRVAKLIYSNQHFNAYEGDGPDGYGLYLTRMEGTTTLAGPIRYDSLTGSAQSGDIACGLSDMCALTWQESGSIWTRSLYHRSSSLHLGPNATLVNDPGFMTGNTNPRVAFLGPDQSFLYTYFRGDALYGRVLSDARVAPTITANTLRLPFTIPYGNNTFARLGPAFHLQSSHPIYGPAERFYQFPYITGLEFRNELNQTIPIFSQAQYDAGNVSIWTTTCNGPRYYTVQACIPDYFCSDPVMPTAYLPLSFSFIRNFDLTSCTFPEMQRTILAQPPQYGTFAALGSLPSNSGVQSFMNSSLYWLRSFNETAIQSANRALSPIYRYYQANQTHLTRFQLNYDEVGHSSDVNLIIQPTV